MLDFLVGEEGGAGKNGFMRCVCFCGFGSPTCRIFFAPGMGIVPFVMHQFRETCAGVLSLREGERGRGRLARDAVSGVGDVAGEMRTRSKRAYPRPSSSRRGIYHVGFSEASVGGCM